MSASDADRRSPASPGSPPPSAVTAARSHPEPKAKDVRHARRTGITPPDPAEDRSGRRRPRRHRLCGGRYGVRERHQRARHRAGAATIAGQPPAYWPAVHLAFIIGALLWISAFVALATSLDRGVSWALGWLSAAAIVVGGAVHIIDSSISGFGLVALANEWVSAPASDRAELVRVGDTLLYVLNGTWRSVHSYFHGLPFLLAGLAVVTGHRYPTWLGWIGVGGGAASLVGGVLQFLGVVPGTERLVIVPAQLVSLWIVAMGVLMWRIAARPDARERAPASRTRTDP